MIIRIVRYMDQNKSMIKKELKVIDILLKNIEYSRMNLSSQLVNDFDKFSEKYELAKENCSYQLGCINKFVWIENSIDFKIPKQFMQREIQDSLAVVEQLNS